MWKRYFDVKHNNKRTTATSTATSTTTTMKSSATAAASDFPIFEYLFAFNLGGKFKAGSVIKVPAIDLLLGGPP